MSRYKRAEDVLAVHKTAIFSIHAPTKRKRAMLDDAMYRYHLSFTKGLSELMQQVEELKPLNKTDLSKKIREIIKDRIVKSPLSNSAKSAIPDDLEYTVKSYLELRKDYEKKCKGKSKEEINKMGGVPGRPTVPRLVPADKEWADRLDAFTSTLTLEEEANARDELLKESRAGQMRPVIFPRCRLDDGFLLLHNPETGKYCVFLNLHSGKSRWANRRANRKKVLLEGLVDVRNNEPLRTKSTTIGELFPINFSEKYQLKKFMELGVPKTAKLLRRVNKDNEINYEIHISFEYQAQPVKPVNIIGVDRGIINLAGIAVISPDNGRVLAEKNVDGRDLRFVQKKLERLQRTTQKKGRIFRSRARLAEADKAVHRAANIIVQMASEYNAQIVLENLRPITDRSRKRPKSNFNAMLNRTQYQKLKAVLSYKLKLEGLPDSLSVSAAYTSMTCPECGYVDKKNRNRKDPENRFNCQSVACDYEGDADLNAARVIALKKLWRLSLPEEQAKMPFAEMVNTAYSFERFLKSLAT